MLMFALFAVLVANLHAGIIWSGLTNEELADKLETEEIADALENDEAHDNIFLYEEAGNERIAQVREKFNNSTHTYYPSDFTAINLFNDNEKVN